MNRGHLNKNFADCSDVQDMNLWEAKQAHEDASMYCGEMKNLYRLTQGLSERTTREYHAALIGKNIIAEHLIELIQKDLEYGNPILSRDNLEYYGEEIAQSIACTDIVIKSLESDNIFLSPVFRF